MTIISLLCISASVYPLPSPPSPKNSPVTEVAGLVKKLVMADSGQSEGILSEMNTIRNRHPENTDILLMYINSLLTQKHYDEGIELLDVLYSKKPARSFLLTRCMLLQRTGARKASCYEEVVKISEQQNLIDSDYITALFFTDIRKFSAVKQKLIKENTFKESDFLMFMLGEETMLHEFFP